jgi:hypothetical protein
MRIRGVEVDHATIQRWVFKFMPEIEIQMHKRKKVVGKRWRIQQGLGFKDQLNNQERSIFKSFYSLAA